MSTPDRKRKAIGYVADAVAAVGAACVSTGFYMLHPAAGWIVAGLALVIGAVVVARGS